MEHVETDCKVEFQGRSFESGGSFLLPRNGKLMGILYAYERENKVGTWHGDIKVTATFGHVWRSCFGDTRQSVYFEWDGKRFYGIYYKSAGDIVRVREIRS